MKKPETTFILSFLFLFILFLWLQGAMNDTGNKILTSTSLATLFTGLGVLGLIYTISIQQSEIDENKKDIEKQKEINLIQLFESGFFKLFEIYIDSKEKIEFNGIMRKVTIGNRPEIFHSTDFRVEYVKGAKFFEVLEAKFDNVNHWDVLNFPNQSNVFYFCFKSVETEMNSYHSKVIMLFDFILNSELSNHKKLYYLNIIFQQAYTYEKEWLYIYSICMGRESSIFEIFKNYPELRKKSNFNRQSYEHFFE